MRVNDDTINLIKVWEGFRAKAYKDPVGIWTIGYGTTAMADVGIKPAPGMIISEKQAEQYLRLAVDKFAKQIRRHITAPINENEFGAFVSLAYNIGPGAFIESTALRRFNDGDKAGAVEALQWFNKAGGKVMRGLQNRRADEARLFLMPATSASDIGKPANQLMVLLGKLFDAIFKKWN